MKIPSAAERRTGGDSEDQEGRVDPGGRAPVVVDGWAIDDLGFQEAVERLVGWAKGTEPRYVVTPNVDHLMQLREDPEFRAAYRAAALRLADGAPLLWAARLRGTPLTCKISGSDLLVPLCEAAGREGLSVHLLGGLPGAADEASRRLEALCPGLVVAGVECPPRGFEERPEELEALLERVAATRPNLCLVALGAPKQECFMHRHHQRLGIPLMLGVGASLDFVAGLRRRAPAWMSRVGLEWAYRLFQEPRRMAHRYLVRDARFARVLFDAWRTRGPSEGENAR